MSPLRLDPATVRRHLLALVARVHAVLNHHLDPLRDFARHIESHLASVP